MNFSARLRRFAFPTDGDATEAKTAMTVVTSCLVVMSHVERTFSHVITANASSSLGSAMVETTAVSSVSQLTREVQNASYRSSRFS